jgi:N4-gp56 family major capsid protein
MAQQTASSSVGTAVALSNSIRTQYQEVYLEAAMAERVYDQIAKPFPNNAEAIRGSSVQVEFLSDMEPGVTAISEVADVVPQALRDATASLTPTSRGEALQSSELLLIQAFTDYGAARMRKIGKNAMESIDLLAQAAACQGTHIERAAARASIDAGTSGHRANDGMFRKAWVRFLENHVPDFNQILNIGTRTYVAITSPSVYADIIAVEGNVVSIAQYQNADILFNHELGAISAFRLVVTPWAKVFYAAGAAQGTDPFATSLSANANALSKTMTLSASTHLDSALGWFFSVGTEETANTFYPKNERIRWTSTTTSIITFVGKGPNGGLRFDHTTSDVLDNSDSVHTIVFGGPESLAKVYAPEVGEFGAVVGPKRGGTLDQFESIGWKFYGGYGRLSENRILRAEVSVSMEA